MPQLSRWYGTWYQAAKHLHKTRTEAQPGLSTRTENPMKQIKILAAALMACLMCAPAFAQNEGIELLKKMEQKFQGLKSVSGSFVQTRQAPNDPFKSKATTPARFWILKPNYFRAEYQDVAGQAPSVQLISDQTFYNYVPQLKQVNTYKFRGESNVRDLNYLLLGFGAKADEITRVYSVKGVEGGNGVRLTPRNPQEASFRYITMKVDPESLYPTNFTMTQTDGTDLSVTMNLGSLQVNPQLSPADFKPNFPKDAHSVSMQ
jgi:outer membrane lipoprotein-sorting protein